MIIKADINVPDRIDGKCYNNTPSSEHCDWLELNAYEGNFCTIFEQNISEDLDKCEKCETQCKLKEV